LPQKLEFKLLQPGRASGPEEKDWIPPYQVRGKLNQVRNDKLCEVIPESVHYQAAEKRPFAAFPSSFVIAAYLQVRLTPQDFGSLASVPIPLIPATHSEGSRPAVPIESGHLFRFIPATLSERSDAGI
jgi:hypothetical protein